jgi:hypothetical protein
VSAGGSPSSAVSLVGCGGRLERRLGCVAQIGLAEQQADFRLDVA